MSQNDIHRYDDIIGLPRPVSASHPRMSPAERAAQFSPFAALTGHGEAIRETARLTERQRELDEDSREILDGKLRILRERLCEKPEIRVCYFRPDDRKEGGAYVVAQGFLEKIDDYKRVLIFEDKTVISVDQIVEIEEEI